MSRHEDRNKSESEEREAVFDPRMAELVLLHSMYPDQLDLNDARLQAAVQSEDVSAKCTQETISGLFLVDQSLEVYFSLAAQYPEKERPAIHCRIVDGSLSRCLQKKLNEDIAPRVRQQDATLIDILQSIIQLWTEHKTFNDALQSSSQTDSTTGIANDLCRYWIYSHHIKSKVKRKLIIDQCEKLHLSGAMLIGKPGLICIEGKREDCDNLWSQIRRLTWQRISLIETETLPPDAPNTFDTFEEHSDRSALFHILQSKGCDTVLKNFFGF